MKEILEGRKAMTSGPKIGELAINTIRFLSVDAVQQANSGHPGLPMGAAAMAYVLWTRFLRHNPTNRGGRIATGLFSRPDMARCCCMRYSI
jgi:transketolase-like protein